MAQARFLAVAVLVLTLSVLCAPLETHGVDAAPGYLIIIREDAVSVSIRLTVFQNLTLILKNQTSLETPVFLPENIRVAAEGINSTVVASDLQNALRQRAPSIGVSNLRVSAESSTWSEPEGRQWFNVSLTFDLAGLSTKRGQEQLFNMSWRSFLLASNVTVSGVEVNNIGEKYIVESARVVGELKPSQFVRTSISVNDKFVSGTNLPIAVKEIRLLNFSSVNSPLSSWDYKYDFSAKSVDWSSKPASLGMRYVAIISESERDVQRVTYGLFYDLTAGLSAPANSVLKGDTLTVFFSNLPETMMGVLLSSLAAVALGASVYERRLLKGTKKKSRR